MQNVLRSRRPFDVPGAAAGDGTDLDPLVARRRSRISPVAVSTTKWSGLTAPETTASPRPGLASMTAWRRRPVTGLAVKRTPATSASIIFWITTARRTARWSMPLVVRYTTARSVHSDAQHRRTASSTGSWPTTWR
jgi:hypothetical protein